MYFVPLPIQLSKNNKTKPWSLNLNIYRNTDYHSLNIYKRLFSLEVMPLLKDLPEMSKIAIEYKLYPQTSRKIDIGNVLTIVDKFFSDTLVESGKIPDDSFKHIVRITFTYGEPLKDNPHALALITPQLKGI